MTSRQNLQTETLVRPAPHEADVQMANAFLLRKNEIRAGDAVSLDSCAIWILSSVSQLHAEAPARLGSVAMKRPMNVFRITLRNVDEVETAIPVKNAPVGSASKKRFPNPNAEMTMIVRARRYANAESASGSRNARVRQNVEAERCVRVGGAFERLNPNPQMSLKAVLLLELLWRCRMLRRVSS